MSFIDEALDGQIRTAKRRTDEFSKSVLEARQQESDLLKKMEEERYKWTRSFEEKNAMIEQLERELACTVQALAESGAPKTDRDERARQNRSFGWTNDPTVNVGIKGEMATLNSSQSSGALDGSMRALKGQYEPSELNPGRLLKENKELTNLVSELESTVDEVKNAWRESDTKLNFRTKQVREMEKLIDSIETESKNNLNEFQVKFEHLKEQNESLLRANSDCSRRMDDLERQLRNHIAHASHTIPPELNPQIDKATILELQERLTSAENNMSVLFSRLCAMELQRDRDREELAEQQEDRLLNFEKSRLKDKSRDELQLRRSQDAQEMSRIQLKNQSLFHNSITPTFSGGSSPERPIYHPRPKSPDSRCFESPVGLPQRTDGTHVASRGYVDSARGGEAHRSLAVRDLPVQPPFERIYPPRNDLPILSSTSSFSPSNGHRIEAILGSTASAACEKTLGMDWGGICTESVSQHTFDGTGDSTRSQGYSTSEGTAPESVGIVSITGNLRDIPSKKKKSNKKQNAALTDKVIDKSGGVRDEKTKNRKAVISTSNGPDVGNGTRRELRKTAIIEVSSGVVPPKKKRPNINRSRSMPNVSQLKSKTLHTPSTPTSDTRVRDGKKHAATMKPIYIDMRPILKPREARTDLSNLSLASDKAEQVMTLGVKKQKKTKK